MFYSSFRKVFSKINIFIRLNVIACFFFIFHFQFKLRIIFFICLKILFELTIKVKTKNTLMKKLNFRDASLKSKEWWRICAQMLEWEWRNETVFEVQRDNWLGQRRGRFLPFRLLPLFICLSPKPNISIHLNLRFWFLFFGVFFFLI